VLWESQQSWHSIGQASARSFASLTTIDAPPSTNVLVLCQLLWKLEMVLAVQLQTRIIGFNTFLYLHMCHPSPHYFAAVVWAIRQLIIVWPTAASFQLLTMPLGHTEPPTWLQTASYNYNRLSEGHRMGNIKGNSWPEADSLGSSSTNSGPQHQP
jgi:hypothetical protein